MGSDEEERVPKRKPHAVCIPFPAQGHVKPMMNLAKLLHSKGFHVTFVNSEFNHRRLLNSGAIAADIPSFRFEAVPDGLPPTEAEITQDIASLCHSTPIHTLAPFTALLRRLNSDSVVPPVTCVISDGCMSFTLDSADELGIPEILFWTTSACGFLGYLHYEELRQRGLTPLKDESCVSNGYLDTVVDWIPGMSGIRLKDLPTFLRTTDPDDIMFNFVVGETRRAQRGKAVILNTFEELESGVVSEIRSILKPPVYTIGALHELVDQLVPRSAASESINPSLWKEDTTCLEWLEGQEAGSVLYVNFGSITVMTSEQLREFAWGLAGSGRAFLWVIRADLVGGESAVVPAEFEEETRERGMVARWCPQERVLKHAAVGGFLTHSGWNSTLESLCVGVPMLCWPFFAEQQTNCWFACRHWAVAMEIDSAAHRHEIARLVTQLMDGDTGKRMTATALRWKGLAHEAVSPGGTTASNFDRLLQQLLSYN